MRLLQDLITILSILQKKIDNNNTPNSFQHYLKGNYIKSLFIELVTKPEIENEILSLNHNKSCGIDGISPLVLKKVATLVSVPLTEMFNMSFETGQVPLELKSALVTPVYKAGDKESFTNYIGRFQSSPAYQRY